METMRNENLITNTSDSNDEKINNISKDEITLHYIESPFLMILFSILMPVFFYLFLFKMAYKAIMRVDKKKKVLIIGQKAIADCCYYCLMNTKQYDLNAIKNIKFKRKEVNVSNTIFGSNIEKEYDVDGIVYSFRGESSYIFYYYRMTKEKYDEFVLFFKQFTEVIEEIENPLKDLKIDNDIPSKNEITTNDEQNNIESKPSFNEGAPIPAMA